MIYLNHLFGYVFLSELVSNQPISAIYNLFMCRTSSLYSTFILRRQCGTEKVISMYSVTRKTDRTRRCGCLKKEVNAKACKDLWKEGKARPFPQGNTLWRLRSSHGTFKKGNIPWNKGKKFLTVRYPNGSKKLLLID